MRAAFRPPLPDHPLLRQVAVEVERMRRVAEITDAGWRVVYVSSELCTVVGATPDDLERVYGSSLVQRTLRYPERWGTDPDSARRWWRTFVPIMRHSLEPETPAFDEVFGSSAAAAARVEPREPPAIWGVETSFRGTSDPRYSTSQHLLAVRLNEPDGRFAGVLQVSWPELPGSVTGLLSRGDVAMYDRMARLAEPARRPAAILFVDLESSGTLSRRLPSRAYFELIRRLTTAVDTAVVAHRGIVGKHAGDGASAFFLMQDFDGSESAAALAAVAAARDVAAAARELEDLPGPVRINAGVHWGSTAMIGQVVTGGRLEVSALGDEVTQAARIQEAAQGGTVLASKELVERIDPPDAASVGIDLARVSYTPLADIAGAQPKVVRDAGAIPVVAIPIGGPA